MDAVNIGFICYLTMIIIVGFYTARLTKNIKDLRIVAKVVGADKNTSVKINNWVAYE